MKRFLLQVFVSTHLLLNSTIASTEELAQSQDYDCVQLYPSTLETISETTKPSLFLTCCKEDASSMDLDKLSSLINKRKGLETVFLYDFKINAAQASRLANLLNEYASKDSRLSTPITLIFNHEQLDHIGFTSFVRNMYESNNVFIKQN
jgi:hypothetical protein